MFVRKVILGGFCACACINLTACMPHMTLEQMKEKTPVRPMELDALDAFVGKWDMKAQTKMAMLDEALETTGSSEAHWEGNRRYLVSHNIFNMGGLGEVTGLKTWTYDARSKKFRTTWTDSIGSIGLGEARYDADTRTWRMKTSNRGPHGKTTAKGWVKVIGDDLMEWSWTEYMGVMKIVEITGTSRRQK